MCHIYRDTMAPILKADRTKLGKYKPVTRETNPGLFRASGTEAESAAQARAALDRMLMRVLFPRTATSRSAVSIPSLLCYIARRRYIALWATSRLHGPTEIATTSSDDSMLRLKR